MVRRIRRRHLGGRADDMCSSLRLKVEDNGRSVEKMNVLVLTYFVWTGLPGRETQQRHCSKVQLSSSKIVIGKARKRLRQELVLCKIMSSRKSCL